MPLLGAVSGIWPSLDKQYIYVAVSNDTGNEFKLARVGIRGQVVPDYILQMGADFPVTLPSCFVDYVNFHDAVLVMNASASLEQACRIETSAELAKDGLQGPGLKLTFSSSVTE
jgi:hypothetical protein